MNRDDEANLQIMENSIQLQMYEEEKEFDISETGSKIMIEMQEDEEEQVNNKTKETLTQKQISQRESLQSSGKEIGKTEKSEQKMKLNLDEKFQMYGQKFKGNTDLRSTQIIAQFVQQKSSTESNIPRRVADLSVIAEESRVNYSDSSLSLRMSIPSETVTGKAFKIPNLKIIFEKVLPT